MEYELDYGCMLKQANLRRTPGRMAMLEVLHRAGKPLSRKDIANRMGEKGLHKVNIYRSLDDFVAAGLVHLAVVRNRRRYYELAHRCSTRQCHPHFICTNCQETFCLTDVRVPLVRGLAAGFILQRQQIRIEGLCPQCS